MDFDALIEETEVKFQMTLDRLQAAKDRIANGEWLEGWTADSVDAEIVRLTKLRDATIQTYRDMEELLDSGI